MWGSAAVGVLFLVLAWVTKNHHPQIRKVNWDWFHALLMLAAGIGLANITARAFNWGFGWFTTLWDGLFSRIHGLPDWLGSFLTTVPKAFPWCVGAAIVLIVVFHMLPKVGKGIHGSTATLAFLAPAAVLFFPPLFSLVSGG